CSLNGDRMSRLIRPSALVATVAAFGVVFTASSGGALASVGLFSASAAGTVFYPNPVQQLGLQNLTDDKDADSPVFGPPYRRVTLTALDTSGPLTGRYVVVKSATGKPAAAVDGAFAPYHRDADQFEQVMGYYWVTTAQHYLQHLGFGSTLRPVNQ